MMIAKIMSIFEMKESIAIIFVLDVFGRFMNLILKKK
jgi:hypothetical protein